jgi:hypothetical protein
LSDSTIPGGTTRRGVPEAAARANALDGEPGKGSVDIED